MSEEKPWIKPTFAKIFHRDALVGTITNITVEDMFQWSGDIELTDAAQKFQVMYDYFNDEDRREDPNTADDPLPFDEAFLDDWFIEDENGKREIGFPVVSDEGEVFWRD